MKDLPHHLKKLNRQIIRSLHREELDEEAYSLEMSMPSPYDWERTQRQIKKQAKARMRKERLSRTATPLTPEEREKKMSHRVPIFDRTNHAMPKMAKPTRKKTPRI